MIRVLVWSSELGVKEKGRTALTSLSALYFEHLPAFLLYPARHPYQMYGRLIRHPAGGKVTVENHRSERPGPKFILFPSNTSLKAVST